MDAVHAKLARLDAFRARSGRFIFARSRHGSELVYLQQGTADAVRATTRSSLMCPEPGCDAPEITTVARAASGRRDGYRHLVRLDQEHAPESAFHRQGKASVVRWARRQPNVVSAEEEVRVGGGERVADVLITLRSAARLAVEVQYASLSVAARRERQDSYRRLGIAVTWLWGHIGSHSPLAARWRDSGLALLDEALPVMWINPVEEQVAWAYDLGSLDFPRLAPSAPDYEFGSFDDLTVTDDGLFPPQFIEESGRRRERADEMRARRREEDEDQAVRDAAHAARVQVRRQERAAQAERERREALLRAPQAALPGHDREAPVIAGQLRCRRCGGKLDPILVPSGYHADPHCDRPW